MVRGGGQFWSPGEEGVLGGRGARYKYILSQGSRIMRDEIEALKLRDEEVSVD